MVVRRIRLNVSSLRGRLHSLQYGIGSIVYAHVGVARGAAMSFRSGYTLERMREIGRSSADRARNSLQRAVMARVKDLTCEYMGVVGTEDSFDVGAAVRASSCVAYRWTVAGDGFEEMNLTHVRTDKAACNGVAFPKGWKTALQFLDTPEIVRRHVERAQAETRVPGLRCRLLGAPARARSPDAGHQPGVILSLNGVATVLCARISGDQWLCHRGSCTSDGAPDQKNPWSSKDLEALHVAETGGDRPRKRIRAHLLGAQLREMIAEKPLDEIIAVAHYRVEQMSASSEGRELDVARVAQRFELMAWHWPELQWDVNVYLLWSWHCRGMLRTSLSGVRLDHLRDSERKIPVPDGIGDAEYCMWRQLEQVAEAESTARQAPCRYLGAKLDSGKYEPDPSRWIRALHYPDGHRSHTKIWFEWRHVTCSDGQPHVVEIKVNHVLDDRRSPPHNPLGPNAVGAGFRFDVKFMKLVGVSVHPAVQYKGICFDGGERPELRLLVPDGGLNIHAEPVAWSLRDGRVVYWSIMQLKDKRPDELIDANCFEVYRDVAKEFGLRMDRCVRAPCCVFTTLCCIYLHPLFIPSSGYDCCGVAISEDDLQDLRADLGVLGERRWLALEWEMPADEVLEWRSATYLASTIHPPSQACATDLTSISHPP